MPVIVEAPGVSPAKAAALATAARKVIGRGTPQTARIVPGAAPPRVVGTAACYRTTGGSIIRHPSAYSKVGWSNMTYCPSTREVVVGADWLPPERLPARLLDVWLAVSGYGWDLPSNYPEAAVAADRLRLAAAGASDGETRRALRSGCGRWLAEIAGGLADPGWKSETARKAFADLGEACACIAERMDLDLSVEIIAFRLAALGL